MNTDIPKNYTGSPSSLAGTPHLTINREAALDLDSCNAFEGPEKLLEVWFAPTPESVPLAASPNGLKSVTAAVWSEMLDMVHCKVLSVVESDEVDAFLLSESSMFVFQHKLVLKTCGITTLLSGLPKILEIAALSAGFPHTPAAHGKLAAATTYRVFYSRKNYLYPEQQRGPHRSWRDEVRALDRLFRRGSAYMIGKMNGEHWYLYITDPDHSFTPPLTPPHEKEVPTPLIQSGTNRPLLITSMPQDETLEILMTDLEEENARKFTLEYASAVAETQYFDALHKARQRANSSLGSILEEQMQTEENQGSVFEQVFDDHCGSIGSDVDNNVPSDFTSEGHALGTVVSKACGIADIYPQNVYPDARVDAYLFNPCGYSANGVIPAPQDWTGSAKGSAHYFTVHVTPEPQCSYASFETNVPARQNGRQTAEIIEQVVNIFKPGRFSVTLFEAKPDYDKLSSGTLCGIPASDLEKTRAAMEAVDGYKKVDRIVHDLNGYDLIFLYFERHNFRGAPPRLGEVD